MQWNPNLSIGVESIDEQHKNLFEMTDRLFEAGKNNRAKEFIVELLDFLDDYTKKHFSDEEAYMLKIGFPEYPNQKKAHDEFINQIKILKKDYEVSGGNILLIINANQIILDWLLQHISKEDKKIGEFSKKITR
jgi:hemerythrin